MTNIGASNGLLRQYLPKGSDLSFYGPGMLDNIADELNARPRKTLGWRTPAEALNELLSDKASHPDVAGTALIHQGTSSRISDQCGLSD